jgi:hypothetical protein
MSNEPDIIIASVDEFNRMSKAEKLEFVEAEGVIIPDPEPLSAFVLQLSKEAPRETKWETMLIDGVMSVKNHAIMLATGNPDLYTAKKIEEVILKTLGTSPSARQISRWIK